MSLGSMVRPVDDAVSILSYSILTGLDLGA